MSPAAPWVVMRADVGRALGFGHLARCLSLARAFTALGARVSVAMTQSDLDPAGLPWPADVQRLAIGGAADDARAFCVQVEAARETGARGPALVVVDHYGIGAMWHEHVRRELAAVAVIDDLADRPLAPDALVNHNFIPAPGHRAAYAPWLLHAPQTWLCGPRFALLSPAYADVACVRPAAQVRSVGVFMGGTDPARLTLPACHALRAAGFRGHIEVAATRHHPDLKALEAEAARDPALTLTLDQPNLAAFFGRHDLQVGAGGGATWERCRLGVPSLTLVMADNQRAVVPALAALGAIATTPDNRAETLQRALAQLLNDAPRRAALAQAACELVDGLGTTRVAAGLLGGIGQALAVRPATADDSHLAWLWRNHPDTRRTSRDPRPIDWPAHVDWFTRSRRSPARHLLIAAIGKRPVGVVRFDAIAGQSGDYEVSLYLDPDLHGTGLGPRMLGAAEHAMAARHGRLRVHAEVLPGNTASRRMFEAGGYEATGEHLFTKAVEPTP